MQAAYDVRGQRGGGCRTFDRVCKCASVDGCISWVGLNSSRPPRHSHLQPPILTPCQQPVAYNTLLNLRLCIIPCPLLWSLLICSMYTVQVAQTVFKYLNVINCITKLLPMILKRPYKIFASPEPIFSFWSKVFKDIHSILAQDVHIKILAWVPVKWT